MIWNIGETFYFRCFAMTSSSQHNFFFQIRGLREGRLWNLITSKSQYWVKGNVLVFWESDDSVVNKWTKKKLECLACKDYFCFHFQKQWRDFLEQWSNSFPCIDNSFVVSLTDLFNLFVRLVLHQRHIQVQHESWHGILTST